VDAALATPGTALQIDLRGNVVPAQVTTLPFYSRTRKA
jgi:hypothetical protein